jgi:tryptophan 2,3-dioxygenase
MNQSNEVLKFAEVLQKDAHKTCDKIVKMASTKTIYQDAQNVWMYNKLAELELRIKELENRGFAYGDPI